MADGMLGMGLVFTLQDQFSPAADRIQAKMGVLTGGADNMAAQITKSLNTMKLGLLTVGAGVALAAPFGMAIDAARGFEAQMSSVNSLLSSEQKAMLPQLETLAKKAGAETKFSALEAAKGIEELVKAGVSLEAINAGGLKGALDLAVAGELELAEAAEIASTALNAFKNDNLTVTQSADILAYTANVSATSVRELKFGLASVGAVASAVGMSFTDTNAALGVFAQNGLKGSDAGTSLKSMLLNLQPGSQKQIELFKQLGLTASDGANQFFTAEGKIKSLSEIAGTLQKSMSHLTDQQRLQAMETLFGTDAIRAANILYKEGADGVEKMAFAAGKLTAAQVAAEKLNNFNGAMEMLSGSMETVLIQVGQLFLPLMTKMVQGFNTVVDAVSKFVDTPLGRYTVYIAAGIAVATIALGTFITVSALARFTSLQLATSFASVGQNAISQGFAVGGFTGGLKQMALASGRALIALAPLAIKVALIAAPFVIGYFAIQKFNNMLASGEAPATGFIGFLQKVGGVLVSVGHIFSSWNGKSFNLGGMEKQLESLGILDFVKNLGTWLVRLIEFGKGVASGFMEAFGVVAQVVSDAYTVIVDSLNSFFTTMGMQEWIIGKNTSSIQDWIEVGKYVGYTLMGVLIAGFASLAVSVIAATWPILAIAGAVAGIVYLIYNWDDAVQYMKGVFAGAFQAVSDGLEWLGQNWQGVLRNVGTWLAEFGTSALQTLSQFGAWVAANIPAFLGQAFQLAIDLVVWQWTSLFPFMVQVFIGFTGWLVETAVWLIGQAFQLAIDLVVWQWTSLFPFMIETMWNFSVWLVTNVPQFFIQGFGNAFNFVYNMFNEFVGRIANGFYDLGSAIISSMLEGIQSTWGSVESYLSEQIASIPGIEYVLGDNAFGSGGGGGDNSSGTVSGGKSLMGGFLSDQLTNLNVLKSGGGGSTVNNSNTTNNQAENLTVNFELDGEKFAKIINIRSAMEQSRE